MLDVDREIGFALFDNNKMLWRNWFRLVFDKTNTKSVDEFGTYSLDLTIYFDGCLSKQEVARMSLCTIAVTRTNSRKVLRVTMKSEGKDLSAGGS